MMYVLYISPDSKLLYDSSVWVTALLGYLDLARSILKSRNLMEPQGTLTNVYSKLNRISYKCSML